MSRTMLTAVALLVGCSSGLQMMPLDDTAFPIDPIEDPDPNPGDDTDDTDQPNPSDNAPPVADAGDDFTAMVASIADLDGTGSYDPDGDALTYSWELVERPGDSTAYLVNATRATPSFFVDRPGEYLVELTVSDGLASDVDDVLVVAEAPNAGPIANAGQDQYVDVGDRVQLNGSSSYDPDGDTLTYAWSFVSRPAGSGASLDNPSAALPSFTADRAGVFTVQLVVSDGDETSSPDQVRITAQDQDDSDCMSCAQAQIELERQMRAGDLASGIGLVLLPIAVLLVQRRRERDQD